MGLEIVNHTDQTLDLGHEDSVVMRLAHHPESPVGTGSEAGLYHTAILFASRAELAGALYRILTRDATRYVGSADHLVSEAFYFTDYEGNGVELYFDREPEAWEWQNGSIVMASLPLDPARYIKTYGSAPGEDHKSVGHIHLQVGDIQEAKKFYVDMLGFVLTAELPGALFISDGRYHHHIGMNTWISGGAGKRQPLRGLKRVTLHIPKNDINELETRLKRAGIPYERTEQLTFRDPWDILFQVSDAFPEGYHK